jgi:hypothetical protein
MKIQINKMKRKGVLGDALIWFYKFFLLTIVALGLVFIVGKYHSIKIDKKPIETSYILISLEKCKDICINCDENLFIKVKTDEKVSRCGNEHLETLCELKKKNVEVKDLYCKETKMFFNNKEAYVLIGIIE